MPLETIKEVDKLLQEEQVEAGQPGLVLVFSGINPYLLPFPLKNGAVELGRDALQSCYITDDRVSRRHVVVEREGELLRVRDLGSTNGVFVHGARLPSQATVEVKPPAVLRIGRTIFLLVADLSPYHAALDRSAVQSGLVVGPTLHAIHQQVTALARGGQGLFLRGESGAGKEIAARLFHQSSPRSKGPLVTVNCATIPKDLAERLLFGAVRGAYSGAVSDAQGYLQAASGGTLFLDEVAELELGVQAKLLRALETREVTPLGGTRPQPLELGLCAATLRDLREAVASGAFREDLYYRIGRPEVHLPPLRERLEEIPFLIDQTSRAAGLVAGPPLVEACLLRPWPGNIRELCAEVRAAAALAAAERSETVALKHLAPLAGQNIFLQRTGPIPPPAAPAPAAPGASPPAPEPEPSPAPEPLLRAAGETLGLARKTVLKLFAPGELVSLEQQATGLDDAARGALLRAGAADALLALLSTHEYNQSSVATALGTSRTTLIKLMDDLNLPRATDLDPERIAAACKEAGGDLDAAARALRVSTGALKKRLSMLNSKA